MENGETLSLLENQDGIPCYDSFFFCGQRERDKASFEVTVGLGREKVVVPLTNREIQILSYIANGNTNKEVAYVLGISEQTIKNHISAILRKLNANDRAHAVAMAIRNQWVTVEER